MTSPERTLSRLSTCEAVRTASRLMPTMTSPSCSPVARLTCGEMPEDERAALAPDAALGLHLRRHVDELQVLQHRDLLRGDGGEVAGHDAAAHRGAAAADGQVDAVADVEVELDRLPVEVVAQPPAVGLAPARRPPQSPARAAGPSGVTRRHDHAALALPVAHGGGALDIEADPGAAHRAAPDDLVRHAGARARWGWRSRARRSRRCC